MPLQEEKSVDNRISEFIKALEEQLSGLSDDERNNALLYYNEYLSDAAESGKDLNVVLKQLGSPESIAAMLKAEESLNLAQKKPGLKNFNKAMQHAFLGVTNPFGKLIRGLFLLFAYSFLVLFMGSAALTLLGAIAGFSVLLYETIKIAPGFTMEKLGTLGMGLLTLSLFFMISFGLYKISRWLIGLASKTLRSMLKKKTGEGTYELPAKEAEKSKSKLIFGISAGVFAMGLILAFSSGLPVKLFNIFNSSKPENINMVVNEYNASDVRGIKIQTAHSCIRVVNEEKKDGKIVITYEQPNWMSGKAELSDGVVSFREASNGRLPLIELVTLHESRTDVTLYLPEDFLADSIGLESKGGFITIMDTAQGVTAKTFSGQIILNVSDSGRPFGLKAKTENGVLDAVGFYPTEGIYRELTINQQDSGRIFDLSSVNGNIAVK